MHWELWWLCLQFFHIILIPILMCIRVCMPGWCGRYRVQVRSAKSFAVFCIISLIITVVLLVAIVMIALIDIQLICWWLAIAVLLIISIRSLVCEDLLSLRLGVLKIRFWTVSRHIATIPLRIPQILTLLPIAVLQLHV